MKKILICFAAFMTALSMSGCNRTVPYYKITGWQTTGIVKDFNKNDPQKQMESSVLTAHLPNMTGEVGFASVKVLGEADGKTYAINVYASYSDVDGTIVCKDAGHEYAAFTARYESDYDRCDLDTPKGILNSEQFLPESLRGGSTGTFDRYVYAIGESKDTLQHEAEDYFSKNK